MHLRTALTILLLWAAIGCSNPSNIVGTDQLSQPDISGNADNRARLPDVLSVKDKKSNPEDDLLFFDVDLVPEDAGPQCSAGEGCFLDPCDENGECQSGWCVDHLGEGVCTIPCSDECPAGWSCQQVAGTAPDLVFVCVSDFANLCRPCATGADCKSTGGAEDVCVNYEGEGSFCGGSCSVDEDCPMGFSCLTTVTVDAIDTLQCVADAGECPCTQKAVALALWTPCASQNESGTCEGKRVCTAEGLSECDAAVAADETCNGFDDDCDGDTDEPTLEDGSFLELCDDGNSCTQDSCTGADGCANSPLDEGECVDGDSCTVGDHCEAGECTGQPILCDDDNPCTDDACDGLGGCASLPNTASCDDGDPCTVTDTCSDEECAGFEIACDCQADADCAGLEDGDLCNGTLICDLGALPYQCKVDPDTISTCPEPPVGPDAICLEANCDPTTGLCSLLPDHGGLACDDGDACTVGDVCQEGICSPGVAANCDDENPCTDSDCDPVLGCLVSNNLAPCDDGNVCTIGDVCGLGICVSGNELLICNDDNPCTNDSCAPATGCQHIPNQLPCDDGNSCTAGEECANGWCLGGVLTECDDDNMCTTDSCDAEGGCVYKLNALPCDDGDVCTLGDHCHLGECISAMSLQCDDDNLCTDDSCLSDVGCDYAPNSANCDDGNACTTDDTCSDGWCTADGVLDCNDGNLCTDGSCDPLLGCQQVNNVAACDDADACTDGDACSNGACQPGVGSPDCNDQNPCTNDACDPATGCTNTNNALPCNDNNACSIGDFCGSGTCQPGPDAPNCNDQDQCTSDSCDPTQGCVNDNLSPCCGNGIIEPGEACDDGNFNNGDGCSDHCELDTGCVILGQDVRTLEQGPDKWQLGYCQTLCENKQTIIPQGWHIATKAEVAFLTKHVEFGSCGAYGICGSYWYGGNSLTSNCNMLKYNCTTGGCWAYTEHCYTQVMLIKDGKDGSCLQ